jgi:hypothetical protein
LVGLLLRALAKGKPHHQWFTATCGISYAGRRCRADGRPHRARGVYRPCHDASSKVVRSSLYSSFLWRKTPFCVLLAFYTTPPIAPARVIHSKLSAIHERSQQYQNLPSKTAVGFQPVSLIGRPSRFITEQWK